MNPVRVAFALFVGALGCGAIGGGAFTNEPDWVVKGEQADQRRQADIATIAQAISLFENRRKELPYDLSKMVESQTDGAAPLSLSDSETAQPYDYERLDARRYKLCANFTLESLQSPSVSGESDGAPAPDPWRHPAGLACFQFNGENPTPIPSDSAAEAKG